MIYSQNENATTFIFQDGEYYINDILNVTKENIKFIGLSKNPKSVHIIQNNSEKDGLNIITNNFTMQFISVHVEYNDKIALIVASANNLYIDSCYFYGNKTTFTIYFAGPKTLKAGQSTIDGYNNNILDQNNVFKNNVVYSQWSGDAVSFSLQNNGIFHNNIVRGGKLVIYMCKNSDINKNIFYDSINTGIHISFPSHNVSIINNKIYECIASGIKSSNQTEHGFIGKSPYNLIIKNNFIYDAKIYAIELNNAYKCLITGNKLISTDIYGIYVLASSGVTISKNKISYFDVAIWFETTLNSTVMNNTFLSVYPSQGKNIVKLSDDSSYNSIRDNRSKGTIIYDKYINPSKTIGNDIFNNTHEEYYDIAEEMECMK